MNLYLEQLSQQYHKTAVLKEINLHIKPGEFLAVLGPSGCGKTTLLRAIAGFIKPTGGRIRTDHEVYCDEKTVLPVEERDLGMVFQSFALWPHMTVREHLAFPLNSRRRRDLTTAEKVRIIDNTLEIMGLAALQERLPAQLSGGQKQRVALARAIVARPSLLLMDEPLSALDAELRVSMRREIQNIHRQTQATIIYVTHDQGEALAMADRILILKDGQIQQVGTPDEIYSYPQNTFVAQFVSRCNLFKGRWQDDRFYLANGEYLCRRPRVAEDFRRQGVLPLRPEEMLLTRSPAGIPGVVTNRQYTGREFAYSIQCESGLVTAYGGCRDVFAPGEAVRLTTSA